MRVTVAASRNARMGRSSEREADERTVRCAARQSEALARAGSGRTSGEDVQPLAEPARLFAHHEEPAVAREFARFCWDLATSRDPTRERSSAAPCIYTEVVAQLQTNVAIGLRRGRDHRSLGHVAVSARASPSSTCAAFLAVRPRHCCGGSAAPGLHAPGGAYPTMRRQMRTRTTSPALRGLLATVLFATGCHESVSPRRGRQGPQFWEVPAQALAFTVQPNNSTPCPSTIAPPVEVTAVDNQGQAVPDFTGDVTIAIGHDASAAGNATLSGTKTVAAVNGVARFGDLCIDQVGSGYMLQATSPGLTDATSTAFDITAAPPTTGDLIVTTTTTGSNLATGYTVAVDDRPTQAIGANDHVTFSTLAAGDHSVTLVGVPSNCTVNEANPQKVSVPAGGTGHADFTISCVAPPPTTGDPVVTTTTTGSNLPAGYTVMVDNGQPQGIGTTGNATYPGLAAADHMVALSVASNCTVSGANPRTVTVPAGGTGHADFTIDCAPTTGELVVTTATTGANLPAGYTVTVDDRLQAIGINDRMTFPALAAGVHSVALSVASNCTVSGGSGRMVSVPAGGTAQVDFVIACAAPPPTLVFTQQPNDAVSNVSLAGSCTLPSTRGLPTTVSGQLTLQDNLGQTVNFTGHVTIQLGQNTGGGTLCGGPTLTFNLQNGVAEFNLSIAQGALETGTYTLVARATVQSSSLSVESVVFTISLVT